MKKEAIKEYRDIAYRFLCKAHFYDGRAAEAIKNLASIILVLTEEMQNGIRKV